MPGWRSPAEKGKASANLAHDNMARPSAAAGTRFRKGKQMSISNETAELLSKLGVAKGALSGGDLIVRSPVTGEQIAAFDAIMKSLIKDVDARALAGQPGQVGLGGGGGLA